ncbi:testis-specific zinc finger protein topi-like [Anopheles albimanus]|uniref:C2H2-type domain-containing protein n=1 Tax=Anopheles albimanus TaxID=7167 RepID=A0A8W7JB94_ANOAL|nr:testis-specific zinc finger protein topi-like [Anopheles albimanus]XP_035776514.1 testis-specific zinc finger protein topi-like [Anopheles albimanus]
MLAALRDLKRHNQIIKAMLQHRKTNADNGVAQTSMADRKRFECTECKNRFVLQSGLQRHREKYHGVPQTKAESKQHLLTAALKCMICGTIFPDADRYHQHVKGHNWDKMLANVPSWAANRYGTIFSQYLRVVAIGRVLLCEYCDTFFSDEGSLFYHESLHCPSNGFECVLCEKVGCSLEQIKLHRSGECSLHEKYQAQCFTTIPKQYSCNVCCTTFDNLDSLFIHRNDYHHYFPRVIVGHVHPIFGEPLLALSCEVCCSVFLTLPELLEHRSKEHASVSVVANKPNVPQVKHKRGLCLQESGTEGEMSELTRPYLCEKCGKTYTQSSHLWQHLRFHNGVRPFGCPMKGCQRRFTIRPDLNDHIRKCHTGERPYLCEICNKRFLTGSVFYQHRLIHRGERRYGCGDCTKRFYRADALKNHQRIHTGEKPYDCSFCDKKFRQRGDREKHVRVKHSRD